MIITDAELEKIRQQEKLDMGMNPCLFSPSKLERILARLDAAEIAYRTARKVIDGKRSYTALLKAESAWLKASGKDS